MPPQLDHQPITDEIADAEAWLAADATDDIAYVRGAFAPLSDAARPLVARGVLPRASYVLPDGTPMVPTDHTALLDAAGGDPDQVKVVFTERWTAAGGEAGEADEVHAEWLGGVLGCCLRSTAPESIAVKVALMATLDALLARPVPDDDAWRGALRGAVDALDAHEQPFARSDRERFGGPVTRDRYITAVRERFPDVWA